MPLDIKPQKLPTLEESLTGTLFGSGGIAAADKSELPIEMLEPFYGQPFKPYSPEKLEELAADIKENGILSPIVVRKRGEKYQILSGHNRVNAAKLCGLNAVPCTIKNVDDAVAELILVGANLLQRQVLLPSEKAFAYKMQSDAKSRVQVSYKTACIASDSEPSRQEIHRYIRLTSLFSPLLDLVDSGKLPMIAGVNLSYIATENQELLHDYIIEKKCRISLKQSLHLRELESFDEKSLDSFFSLSREASPKNVKKVTVPMTDIEEFFDSEQTEDKIVSCILTALREHFGKAI